MNSCFDRHNAARPYSSDNTQEGDSVSDGHLYATKEQKEEGKKEGDEPLR